MTSRRSCANSSSERGELLTALAIEVMSGGVDAGDVGGADDCTSSISMTSNENWILHTLEPKLLRASPVVCRVSVQLSFDVTVVTCGCAMKKSIELFDRRPALKATRLRY